jgi:hypothetical protein
MRLSAYRDIGTRIGGSYWLNTAYPGFVVGDHTGVLSGLGATLSVVTVAAGGFLVTLAAGLESVAGGGAAVAAGCLEHAAQTPRSIAMPKRVLIAGLPFDRAASVGLGLRCDPQENL